MIISENLTEMDAVLRAQQPTVLKNIIFFRIYILE